MPLTDARSTANRHQSPRRYGRADAHLQLRRTSLNLLAVGAALAGLACGGDVTAPNSGSLAITTSTSGPVPDDDGYAVTVDGGAETPLATNGTVERGGLQPGTHSIQLTGFAPNCSVEGENPRPVTVIAGQQASTTFSVLCPTPPPYRAIDLGTLPGGRYSSARDINSAGQVVGRSWVPGISLPNGAHPFLWENGVLIDLAVESGSERDDWSEATAINPAGNVVGVRRTLAFRHHFPALWEDGVLNHFSQGEGYATDINPAGLIVGCLSRLDAFECHAALWENGVKTDLGTLAGGFSEAYGIDPTGRVVGKSDGHAFLWENGVMTDLNIPGGESIARRINAAGQIVGEVVVGGVTRGFIWENGVTTDLGEVVQVNDINAGGQVVGWRNVEGVDRALVWKNGIMTDLPGPSHAFGINDEGQIVGDIGPGVPDLFGRELRATLWTPWEQ